MTSPRIFICLLGILISLISKGQLSGTVKESETDKAVSYITVSVTDTSLQKNVMSTFTNENGDFKIENLKPGTYRIKIQSLGHEIYIGNVLNYTNVSINTGVIYLKKSSKDLKEVTVSATKPLLEIESDKMVFNVEDDETLKGQTALDALKKLPFISVDGEENIQMKGSSNFKVLLNGKSTSIVAKNPSEALRSFPANLIKKIEVITEPSAKYDSDGTAGIINIITHKKIIGYNGSLYANYSTRGRQYGGGSLNMKFGKFGFSSYLGAHSNKLVNQFSNEYYRTSKVPGTVKSLEQTGIGGTDAMWYWGNLELAYDFDTLHTLSIYASPNGGYRNNTNGQNSTQLDSNGMVLSSFDNDILSKNNFPSFDIGFDFIKKFKDNDDHRLNFTAIRELNENNSSYNSLQTYTDRPNVDLNNTNDSRNTEYTLNLDYEKPLKNKSSFETGSKFIFRHLVSDYRMLSRSNASENYTEIPENTNSLSYIQNVGSVYATYARSIKQIKVKLGGRVEQTWIDAQFNSNLAKFTDDYLNFIPTVSLSTKVKKIHTVRLNYSKRIQRPWMYYLNPYVDNSNPQNISFGNPNLVPEKTHSLSLSWNAFVKKNSIDLTLSNSFTDNVITSYTTVESDGIAYTSYYNIARSNSTGINLSFWGSAFDRLKIWLSVSSSFVHITHKLDASQNRSGFSQRGHGSFTWTFDKGFTSSVSGWFWQGAPTIQSIRPLNYNYDFAIRKSMFDKKLHLGFVVTNFLQKTQTLKTTSEDPTFSAVSYNRNLVFRYFSVSASFNFGKLKENVSRKRGISNDDKKTEGSGGK